MIYAAMGRRQRGKSTLVLSLARKVPQRVIFDLRGQFPCASVDRVTRSSATREAIDTMAMNPSIEEIVITPSHDPQPVLETMAIACKDFIEDFPHRSLAIVIDEVRFVDTNVSALEWILRCSNRHRVSVFFTAHRPVNLSTDIRAILDQWLIFHCTLKRDLIEIREHCGDDVARAVRRLRAYQWIQWDDGAGEMFEHLDASQWYVPLHDTAHDSVALIDAGVQPQRIGMLFDH